MFRAVLELLVLMVSERGWKDGSASCAATMDEKEPDHPIRHYIEGLRKSHVEGLIPDADTLVLGKALGDGPEARKYVAAVERLIHETLDEIEEDPATEAFERMINLQIARLHKKVIKDPATKKLVMTRKMNRKEIKKRMGFPTEH